MEITKQLYIIRSSKLENENAKHWVEFERSSSYLRLAATCSKIARTSVKVGKTALFPLVLLQAQKRRSSFGLTTCWFTLLRWAENEHYYAACTAVSVVWAIEHFYKNKASHHKQRQLNCCFLSFLYFLSTISAFVCNKYTCNVFYRSIRCVENLFISLHVCVLPAGIYQNLLF